MTILLDATTAQHARGIRTVIEGVLSGLPEDGEERLVVGGPDLAIADARQLSFARTRLGRLLYQRLLLPLDVALQRRRGPHRIDRVLLLDAYLPLLRPQRDLRYAALVHDLLPLTHPHYWPFSKRVVKKTACLSLRNSRATLFTSTEHNAAAIRTLLRRDARVVRFGCGQLSDDDADRAVASPLPEQDAYLVYVGALEHRKNINMLLRAFELVSPELPDYGLVLIGDGSPGFVHALRRQIHGSRVGDKIEIRSQIPREEALRFIARAKALLFPSLAEGFGLPILEALALGTPVVASDIPEIRTWVEGAVALASPLDATEWSAPILEAVTASSERRRAGQRHCETYRWRTCAQNLIDF